MGGGGAGIVRPAGMGLLLNRPVLALPGAAFAAGAGSSSASSVVDGSAAAQIDGGTAAAEPAAKYPRLHITASAGSSSALSTATPSMGAAAVRSRVGGISAGVGPALPIATPSLAKMRAGGMGLAAPTPVFNPLLPKTPADALGGASRRPRRGEVLYAMSENGSPVGVVK